MHFALVMRVTVHQVVIEKYRHYTPDDSISRLEYGLSPALDGPADTATAGLFVN